MALDWLTPDEIERATGLRTIAQGQIARYEAALAKSGDGSADAEIRRNYEYIYRYYWYSALTAWLLDRNVDEVRKNFRLAADVGVERMKKSIIEKAVYLKGKFFYLYEKDGKRLHRNSAINKRIAEAIPDIDDVFQGQIPDLSPDNAFAFFNDFSRLAEISVPSMEAAWLSGDMDLAKSAAELAGTLGDFDFVKAYAWYARVLKYLTLEDEPSARKCILELEDSRKGPYQQLAKVYAGLIDGDEGAVLKAFEEYKKWIRSKRKPSASKYFDTQIDKWVEQQLLPYDYLIHIPGLVVCSIAAWKGVKILVDEQFLPRELLPY